MKKAFDNQQSEKHELDILIQKGIVFDLERTVYRRRKGFKGLFLKRFAKKETLTFKIEEPTLSTLDRIASEQIDLVIDESLISSETGLSEAKKLAGKYPEILARIIAYAVLGQDYVKGFAEGSRTKYVYDDNRLDELTEMFFHNIKPSKLLDIVLMINAVSNLGDFCNSIRLMSASRTTMPILVEEKQEA